MSKSSFVRTAMIAPSLPPASERGVIKWLRENLFSGPFNTILTLVAIWAIYTLIKGSLPWLSNSVWNAESLRECRDIVIAQSGEEATGACWAMVRVRWNQFLFGLYEVSEYWRPTTAFALMFVALTPVLYYGLRRPATILVGVVSVLLVLALFGLGTDSGHILMMAAIMAVLTAVAWIAPKRLVIVTILFPLIAFYMLWGGSVWGPVGTFVGFAIFALVWWIAQRFVGVVVAAAVGLIAAAIWWGTLQTAFTTALHTAMPIELLYIRSDDFGGFLLAFVIGITAITASLPIGILLALGRQSDMPIVKTLSVGFIEFFRGVPLITVLFAANFMLLYFLPPRTNFDLILRVIIVVIIFASAYIAEVIRGGLAALPRGQYEAADALGLDYWQAQRLIIMPQALKISIPGIVSSFIGLFKDTTLVALVGLMDPLQGVTKVVRSDTAWKGIYWEPYLFVGAIFFLVCFSMSRYSMYLENKLKTDHR
ncbi:MAG: amino acid ABC transporter permease [Microgenomates group bacterium]